MSTIIEAITEARGYRAASRSAFVLNRMLEGDSTDASVMQECELQSLILWSTYQITGYVKPETVAAKHKRLAMIGIEA